jgi:regulatory protein
MAGEDAAKEAALRILARGPRTEREVADRLLAKGFDQDAVERALKRLRRVSLLDDRAFLRSYLRSELPRKPQGRRLLLTSLRRRGVPAALLEEMDEILGEEPDLVALGLDTEEGRARAALELLGKRGARVDPDARDRRLVQALGRRGFDWDVIRDVTRARDTEEAGPI